MSDKSGADQPPKGNAWVTLATNDTYALGAIVLARSLNQVGTKYAKCVMITDSVSKSMTDLLKKNFENVVVVDLLDSGDTFHLAMLARPELGVTFTKIHCWLRTEYEKCVFLDADTLVLEKSDELFEREELSAAPDVGWPDCFNSGVFVFRPSEATFASIASFALENKSFDGGDQGLLNLYFKNWSLEGPDKRLPFFYNMCSTACYSYLPAFKMYGGGAKIIHFIGPRKPWTFSMNPLTRIVDSGEFSHLAEYIQKWWDLCFETVFPQLSPDMTGLPGTLSRLSVSDRPGGSLEEHWRRTAWESSSADYMGRDSFDKVWEKIQSTMEKPSEVVPDIQQPASSSSNTEESGDGKTLASGDSEKVVQAEPPANEPKGAPLADAPSAAVATPPLPSALVDVDSSSASSNLGSLAQTSDAEAAPIPPKRRGGPSKGGKSAVQKGKK